MEEFLKIDWNPPLENIIDDVFIDEKRLKDESAMYKIMQGVFSDPFTEFESDDSEGEDYQEEDNDEENNKIDNKNVKSTNADSLGIKKPQEYIPGIIKPHFRFPRTSSLSKEQHATCLKVLLRYSGREKPEIDPKNRSELESYMELCPKIKEEQEEYLNLAKTNWRGSNLKLIEKQYVQERWKSKIKKLKKRLPRYYTAAGNVPFKSEGKLSVNPEATLLEMGRLPRVIIPGSNKKRNIIYCDMSKLDLLYPASDDTMLEKPVVSEDKNCERLAESGEIDLVISSSGLNCLANNFPPNYNIPWVLPIVVKGTPKGNVIYIDKALPPTALTIPHKNSWIYKYILKSQLLNPNHYTSISLSDHEKQESGDHGIFGNPYSDDLLKLEEENDQFHVHDSEKAIPPEEKSTINESRDGGDPSASKNEEEINSIYNNEQIYEKLSPNLINEDESGQTEKNCSETNEVSMESDPSEDKLSFSNITKTSTNDQGDEEMPEEQIIGREKQSYQDSTKINVPPIYQSGRSNLAYRIFSLGQSVENDNDSSRTNVETYKILVRTKTDGVEKIDKETLHPVMLVPKLEHQVALGAEAVTADEAIKQWTTLTYRPNTSVVRIRISAENSEVIQTERRTAISINNEIKRLYNLNVEDSFVILHNVIHHLKALKPGHYLLKHTPTNGAFATIYQEAESSGKNVIDLHAFYSHQTLQTICNVPWPAIDKLVVTPSQKYFERMPAMFYPARYDTNIISKVTRGRERGGSRGRGRGIPRGAAKAGGSQDSGTSGTATGTRTGTAESLRGARRVRTKKAKKKKKGGKTAVEKS